MKEKTNIVKQILGIMFLLAGVSLTATGKVIYVDADAVGANNGSSWIEAYVFLQDALADADSADKPVEIRVAPGIYKPDQGANQTPGDQDATFQLINGVTIKGGYAGFGEPEPDVRDVDMYETILSGDLSSNDMDWRAFEHPRYDDSNRSENSYHVVTGSGTDTTAVLDGLTITAGTPRGQQWDLSHNAGGGMYNIRGSPTMIDCTFAANRAEGPSPVLTNLVGYGAGGGIYNSSSSPTLINCTFVANWAGGNFTDGHGGGMYNLSSTPTLIGCTFNQNGAGGGFGEGCGGGIYNSSSDPVLMGCIFSDNDARDHGGGMYNRKSSLILLDCTFTGNQGAGMQNSSGSDLLVVNCIFNANEAGWRMDAGGGIHNSSGSLTIVNCTFTGHSAESGKALACEESNVRVVNSILWDGGNEVSKDDDTQITITYSDVQGGWPGDGNMDADPLFADSDGGDNIIGTEDDDLRLSDGSPCVNRGSNSEVLPWVFADLDGHSRISNGTVDMGAYESGGYGVPETDFVLSTKWVTVPEAGTAIFTVALARDPLGTVEVTIAHRSGDADITVESGVVLTFDSSNYAHPQAVTLAAAEDGDFLDDMALIWIRAPGLAPTGVIAGEWDNDEPPPLYVDADATGANNGSSWADAVANLQDALSLARTSLHIEQIRVGQGIYTPDRGEGITTGDRYISFELIEGVALMGGYAGFGEPDPNARDIKQYETILSGDLNGDDTQVSNASDLIAVRMMSDNALRVVEATDVDATTILDGFTITGGKGATRGAGMWNDNASTTIRNCTFRCNSTHEEYGEFPDRISGEGGGLYSNRGSPTLTNCTFSSNASSGWGGGIANRWSNPTLINCIFSGNYATNGSGISNLQDSTLTLINCTLSGNSGPESWSVAIDSSSRSSYLVLTNCILWGNGHYQISSIWDEATVSYSNIQNGWPGEGNIIADPLFIDPLGPDGMAGTKDDDFHLAPLSFCVDAGDPNYVPGPNETDLDGNPCIVSGRVDMGAYEFQGILHVDDDALDVGRKFRELAGTESYPFRTIQDAINIAKGGYTIRVQSGVYSKIDFLGKAITVKGVDGTAVIEAPMVDNREGGEDAVTFHTGEGPDSVLNNFIIRNSGMAVSLNSRSSPTISNLTIVDNDFGIAAYENSTPDISNCIFWNNEDGDLFQCEVRYSCVEGGAPGEGNISIDPLFVDPANGDYHLKSEGWRWSSYTETWTYDDVTSWCVDAGDPDSPLGDELMSWKRDPDNLFGLNRRINMGTFGGTWQASMPPTDWVLPEYETIPPEPNPAQWAPDGAPVEVKSGDRPLAQMEAIEASDASGWVEYFFECTTEPDLSSDWQISPTYSVSTSRGGQGHRFRVKARDLYGNETAWSVELPAN